MAQLQRSATLVRAESKAHVGLQIASLQLDLDSAEGQLARMMKADASRWRDFEAELAAATARLRETLGHLDG